MTGGVVVIFALAREAGPYRRRYGPAVISGVGARAAAAAARAACAAKPRLVIAAGYCGGLAGHLRVGDIVRPAVVLDEAGREWACVPGGEGRLLTASRIVGDPAEKRALGGRFLAVDMESAAVGAVCAVRGVPFAAARAVSDTSDTALSPELVKLLAGGTVSPLRAAGAVLWRPAILGEFRRLARDTRIAAGRLADAVAAVTSPPLAHGG